MLHALLEWLARLLGLSLSRPLTAQAELPALAYVRTGEYAADALHVRVYGDGSTPREGVEVRFRVLDGPALASWRQVLEGIPATPGLRPGMHVLVDAQVARLDFLFSDSVQLLALVKQYLGRRGGGGYRSAWVVASEVDYGVSRMVMTMLRDLPIETAVFTDLGKAEAWVVGGGRPAPASAAG